MKWSDLLDQDQLLLVVCHDCTAKTPLDPVFFALRKGANAEVEDAKSEIVCPVCGTDDVSLKAFSPVDRHEHA